MSASAYDTPKLSLKRKRSIDDNANDDDNDNNERNKIKMKACSAADTMNPQHQQQTETDNLQTGSTISSLLSSIESTECSSAIIKSHAFPFIVRPIPRTKPKQQEQRLETEIKESDPQQPVCPSSEELDQHLRQTPVFDALDDQQKDHVIKLGRYAQNHLVLMDLSEVGTGKSFCGYGTAEQIRKTVLPQSERTNLLVFTLKAVIPDFIKLGSMFAKSVNFLGVTNLELALHGRFLQFDPKSRNFSMTPSVSPYWKVQHRGRDSSGISNSNNNNNHNQNQNDCSYSFHWKLPPKTLVVFDEAHKYRNVHSISFQFLRSLIDTYTDIPLTSITCRILLASFTMLERVEQHLASIMFFARFISQPDTLQAKTILQSPQLRTAVAQVEDENGHFNYESVQMDVLVLHYLLTKSPFPCAHGMKMTITQECRRKKKLELLQLQHQELTDKGGDLSSVETSIKALDNVVRSELRTVVYRMPESDRLKIQESLLRYWHLTLMQESGKISGQWHLLEMNRLRVSTEFYKVDLFIELTRMALESGLAPVIMFNFAQNLAVFEEKFNSKFRYQTNQIAQSDSSQKQLNQQQEESQPNHHHPQQQHPPQPQLSIVRGGQTTEERYEARVKFQDNETQVLAITTQSGGTGMSAHDLGGDHPRIAFINPPLSSTQLVQALGRCHRLGSESDSWQEVVTVADTIEQEIISNQENKMTNQNILNCGSVSDNTKDLFHPISVEEAILKQSVKHRSKFALFIEKCSYLREKN